MPTVRVSSMYDLQTGTKFGIIGIHTPSSAQLATKYDGLLRNYKYVKVKRCSVKIACASVLPADPLQVGVTAGKISPADMMNPILYKAVSNDSWNTIVSRIYNSYGRWGGDSADGMDDAFPGVSQGNTEKLYYSMLSSREWRKVMPQQGLSVKGLKPLVHEVVSVFGQQFRPSAAYADKIMDDIVASTGNSGGPANACDVNTVFRGRSIPMPAIPTVQVNGIADPATVDTTPVIPKTMVLAIVMPFCQLQTMYYRMIVTWDIAFFGIRPTTDWSMSQMISDGSYTRYSRWSIESSKDLEPLDDDDRVASVGCVDSLNVEPVLQMES